MARSFTDKERDYLRSQRLGRLATVDRNGAPQNNPVGFAVDDAGRILIGGFRMAETRKFKNVKQNPNVAFVVDDLKTVDPWAPRMIEMRGTAEALDDADPPMNGMARHVIRITPTWIRSFGLE